MNNELEEMYKEVVVGKMKEIRGGLISLWLYKENNKLWN
jgi:hypothetical protein